MSTDEDKVLRVIVTELGIELSDYNAILNKFENMKKGQPQSMSIDEAYTLLGASPSDDMNSIKKTYRNLVREYHPDIMISQEKDEAYIEEATAKMQEINQAYQVIKEVRE